MNALIEGVTATARDGKVTNLEVSHFLYWIWFCVLSIFSYDQQVYIRGSQIRLVIFPDMLRHSPMFKMLASKNKNRSLGLAGQKKTMAMRARAGTAMMRGGRGRGRPGGER